MFAKITKNPAVITKLPNPAVVAEWSNLACFKFKWRQMVRSWARIPLEAILKINI